MQAVQDYLLEKQNQFAQHSLFKRLVTDNSLDEFNSLTTHLSFWIILFHDLFRLNEERITNVELRNIVRQHRLEAIAHYRWFWEDLNQMGYQVINWRSSCVQHPFQEKTRFWRSLDTSHHTATREATYALMSEVFQASNDYERITLILALESVGHVFSDCAIDFIENIDYSTNILYFYRQCLNCIQIHEILNNKISDYIDNTQITQQEKQRIFHLIDRVYNVFILMFNGLELAKKPNTNVGKASKLVLV